MQLAARLSQPPSGSGNRLHCRACLQGAPAPRLSPPQAPPTCHAAARAIVMPSVPSTGAMNILVILAQFDRDQIAIGNTRVTRESSYSTHDSVGVHHRVQSVCNRKACTTKFGTNCRLCIASNRESLMWPLEHFSVDNLKIIEAWCVSEPWHTHAPESVCRSHNPRSLLPHLESESLAA